ncbi:iron complex transport system permease protein [Frondihabitans sp. PhB188]|uniref:FecCD family ABC transporter permease n=1 Tax=Frondihabitans sp. PhB188 TaxID=2485200 RepID=UPI000F465129|nr:iron ABC transporter permease [Frondihabitans sp. PhB188]ROQ41602.1 iron complex transport system permease protein [Frondihabitans sp. PhB188]
MTQTAAPAPTPAHGAAVADRRRGPGRRRVGILLGLVVAVAVTAAASVAFGSNHVQFLRVFEALLHPGDDEATTIVQGVRIPRTILGIVVGACLGVAGAVMQGQTRNPLADPGLFGVSAGAGLAVVIGVFVFGVADTGLDVWLALAGALVASVAVFSITAAGSGTASPVPLALAGAAVSALLDAFTSFIVLADKDALNAYRLWVVGSLSGRDAGVISSVVPFALAGLVLAFLNSRALDNLGLGSDMARSLGQNVLVARITGLASITLLTAAATAAAGPVGFVGLVVPHLARAIVGGSHRYLIPASMLIGIALVLGADVVGRLIGGSGEVQVGIVLAVLGGPFFVAVARRRSLVAL